MSKERILTELKNARNTQLDGAIVDVLLELIAKGEITIQDAPEEKAATTKP